MAVRILGIDPGTRVAGYALLEREGRQVRLLECDSVVFRASDPLPVRITQFYTFFAAKLVDQQVTHCALETPFAGKNLSNFLKLGYLRGALYIAATQRDIALLEYAPREVKQQVTGYGGADKEQVARALALFFPGLKQSSLDAFDALAVAYTALSSIDNRS